MVTMAQSAANWRNTHTHMDRMHSLTQLHQHSVPAQLRHNLESNSYFEVT